MKYSVTFEFQSHATEDVARQQLELWIESIKNIMRAQNVLSIREAKIEKKQCPK